LNKTYKTSKVIKHGLHGAAAQQLYSVYDTLIRSLLSSAPTDQPAMPLQYVTVTIDGLQFNLTGRQSATVVMSRNDPQK